MSDLTFLFIQQSVTAPYVFDFSVPPGSDAVRPASFNDLVKVTNHQYYKSVKPAVTTINNSIYGEGSPQDELNTLKIEHADVVTHGSTIYYLSKIETVFNLSNVSSSVTFDKVSNATSLLWQVTETVNALYKLETSNFKTVNTLFEIERWSVGVASDSLFNSTWQLVHDGVQELPFTIEQAGDRFLNFDFSVGVNTTPNHFDFSINQPDRYSSSGNIIVYGKRSRTVTMSNVTLVPYENKPDYLVRDLNVINWGYSLNRFVVGGVTTLPNNPEDGVVVPPDDEVIEHINYEVYRVVNSVIIKETSTGNTVNFDSFTISHDLESFAWTVQFDVLDKDSFELIRPVGRTLKVIDIKINDETFTLVVAKGSIQRRQGKVVYRCSGWSRTKLLADPYATKRSFTDTQARTAAQIVDRELTGSGFNYTWSTVDWQIPTGVHSYQDKTPLGAIIAVTESVGAVIVPHPTLMQFDVRPYYPNSPWQWDSAGLNRSMNELQFFEITNDPVPKPNPDGIYVYGEDNNGVGVKVVRSGKPGQALLSDVVNKYITENIAGQERGRVEVSKNCFIDKYTMTTYVDENGIIKPHELIQFTDTEGGIWRGMVLSTSVKCARVGTALLQTIQVARFYDD